MKIIISSGSHANASGSAPCTLIAKGGARLRLSNLTTAPSITEKEFSVAEITSNNECSIMLHKRGSNLLGDTSQSHSQTFIEPIQLIGTKLDLACSRKDCSIRQNSLQTTEISQPVIVAENRPKKKKRKPRVNLPTTKCSENRN